MCQRSSSYLHLAAVLGLLAREDESASRTAPDWTAVTACAVVVVTTQSALSRQATATAGSFTAATLSVRHAQRWSSSITVIKLQSDLCMFVVVHVGTHILYDKCGALYNMYLCIISVILYTVKQLYTHCDLSYYILLKSGAKYIFRCISTS